MAENNDFAMGYAMGQDSGGGCNDGFGFGGGWGGLIGLLIVASLFGGGWGFGGMGFGGMGGGMMLNGMATRADINEGFALNNITGGITAIQQGICDSTYALNNAINSGFHGQTVATMQGFNGVERGFCDLSHQLSDCCCQNREAIAQVRYDMATQACDTRNLIQNTTRDLIDNANANTRQIMDFLVQDKIAALENKVNALETENQTLKFSASQDRQSTLLTTAMAAQTQQIVNAINPPAVPSYSVPNPRTGHWGVDANCGYGYAA